MKASRFVGSTNREALRQVRLALGPDAIILSNRRINGGVEIMAADSGWTPDATVIGAAGEDSSVLSKLGEMREALESRMQALMWGNQLCDTPSVASLYQTLLECGFSTALLHAMLKRLPAGLAGHAAQQWARDQLVSHLPPVENDENFLQPGALIALVGPTGVGKTTTIAKLAARCVRRTGPTGLVLATTDTWRIGAHEQLMLYGKMLGVPVHVARDEIELNHIIQGLEPVQTLLIDNVGVSQRDRRVRAQAALMAAAVRPVQRLLVMNAASHGDTLDDVAQTYSSDGGPPLQGCVVSKVDETIRLGAVLDTAIRFQLPIRYVSVGQRVPEDLACPTAAVLVDQALAPRRRSPTLYVPSEADLAALLKLGKNGCEQEPQSAKMQRRHVLSGLLALAGTAADKAVLSGEEVEAACHHIAETPVLAAAYSVWCDRAHRQAGKNASSAQENLTKSTSLSSPSNAPSASRSFNLSNPSYGLESLSSSTSSSEDWLTHVAAQQRIFAAHLQANMPVYGQWVEQLGAVLLFGADGQAIASPTQSVRGAAGWQSSCGAASVRALSPAEAMLHQVKWSVSQPGMTDTIHYFAGFKPNLVRHVQELEQIWISAVTPSTAIWVNDEMTTVAALARNLDYRPVTLPEFPVFYMGKPRGSGIDMQPWVGEHRVCLVARGQALLSAWLVALRLMGRSEPHKDKTLYALVSQRFPFSERDYAARCLLLGHESGSAMRYALRLWRLLNNDSTGQLVMASHAIRLGLAAWQLSRTVENTPIRRVASVLAGLKAETDLPSALLKLFALKDTLQR
ncbi:hypothetical protein [Pusillimonas sp. ANT_WB101]|uniref:hypothetical protein n=1 Tax=Pusillimonas sp. ANT_WB101 TaxID=2597356 RepID=UPI0011EE0BEF|nr:hypothetical protein [Pusillimonas sp. ANT_WB101]KAA0910747.1 hypothetical protein FQ179_02405 [Pusillimonas sp. ANT_WB101]